MLVTTLAIAIVSSQALDYFPLRAGMEWTYTVSFYRNMASATQVNRVLEPIQMKGVTVTPMTVQIDNGELQTSYYAVRGEFMCIVAQSQTDLLPTPVPVLPLNPDKKKNFEFNGAVEFLGGLTPSTTKTRVVGIVKTTVLGQERKALKVTRETNLGGDKTKIVIKSTELYVDGIGLVFQRQESSGKNSGWAEYLLANFKDGKS